MRLAGILVLLALGASAAARAGDLGDPVWTQAPDRDAWARAYPTEAAKAGISGAVKMRCAATSDGGLQSCAVVEETPVGHGFGAAALSLANGMQLRITGQNGELVAGRQVLVPVRFAPELLHPGSFISNPDWMRTPTVGELQQFLPAKSGGSAGRTRITCVVSSRGLLERCAIDSETPIGHGFGPAALAMSAIFVMRPMTVDGLPVGGGEVSIPIVFEAGAAPSPADARMVMRAAPWSAVPTTDQVAQAFPRGAVGKVTSAHVVLRCGLKSDGGLTDCETVSETPEGQGFAHAAMSLTRDFHVLGDTKAAVAKRIEVDVPFDFEDPNAGGPPVEVYDPLWLKSVSPSGAGKLFPAAAVKAGLKTGSARVACTVAQDGTLKACSVSSEDPAGMGFGDAALLIASVMQMNPWTAEGSPVDGAHIVLPIKLVLPDDAPAAPAGQPPKP